MRLVRYFLLGIVFVSLAPYVFSQERKQIGFDYDLAVRTAQELAINGNYADARILCNKVLRDIPEYTDARIILGNTFAWEKDFNQAREEYYKVFEITSGDINAFKSLIDLEMIAADLPAAIDYCNTALKFHPDNQDILLKKANATSLSGDFLTAKKCLLDILTLNPTNQEAIDLYTTLRAAVPVRPAVIEPGEENSPVEIVSVDTLYRRAQYAAWAGNAGEARYFIGEILKSRPDFFEGRVLAAQTYAWGGDYEGARSELRPIHVENTGYRDGILTWIDVERWAAVDNNYDEAHAYADLGLRFYPDDEEIILKKVELYELEGRFFEAKRLLYDLILENPSNSSYAQLYNRLMTQADMAYQSKNEENLDSEALISIGADSLLQVANQMALDGDYYDAQAICKQILNIDPTHYDAGMLMGNTYAWNQQYDQARYYYQDLLDHSFDDPAVILAMVNNEIWDGQYLEALSLIDYGLNL